MGQAPHEPPNFWATLCHAVLRDHAAFTSVLPQLGHFRASKSCRAVPAATLLLQVQVFEAGRAGS